MEPLIAWGLTTLVGAFIGSFLGGYLKKKGENHATHEDIGKLVDQMAAVTTATKEIEAKISNDVWERQRKWEVKREALFEALKELGNVEYAMGRLMLTLEMAKNSIDSQPWTGKKAAAEVWMTEKKEAAKEWNMALVTFKKARILALLVCGQDLRDAFETLEKSIIALTNEAVSDHSKTSPWFQTTRGQINAIIHLVRQELHVDAEYPRLGAHAATLPGGSRSC
jgi:hypothetical protein